MKASDFNKLPLRTRRKILRQQAEPLVGHYAQIADEEFPKSVENQVANWEQSVRDNPPKRVFP